ncbi:MAG: AMIN domain-containing protein [Candidatus Sulfotelmatobacter sp.]
MLQRHIHLCVILLLVALSVNNVLTQTPARNTSNSKSTPTKPEITTITSVRVVVERGVPAIEILSTQPAVPSIQFLDSPPRLVIDLLHAQLGLKETKEGKSEVQQPNILGVHSEQFKKEPPVARIVVDLLAPYSYTWDEAGNRLMVRLKAAEDVNASGKKKSRPAAGSASLGQTGAPALVPVTGTGGEVRLAGSKIAAGSSLTTAADTAVLELSRGGEVRLCPRTTVSVTPSKNGKDLMLGMSTGALETHYALQASADTVMTPDFRIMFAGPGEFDFAVSADSHGNTCVRGLTGNTSSAIVSELMGDRIYQVKPTEQVVFRAGRIDQVDNNVPLECGCPPPAPVMRAAATDTELPANGKLGAGELPVATETGTSPVTLDSGAGKTLTNGPETQPLPPSQPNEVHVQVDQPFAFHAKPRTTAPPAPTDEAAALPVLGPAPAGNQLEIQIQPPAESQKPDPQSAAPPSSAPRRLLRRIKGFFGAIFR